MSTIRYSVSGLREGPALLLLHAMGANRHMWDECATLWSPQFAVVACDLRGAGESPPPDRPWTPEDHANDVEAVRAELGLDQIIPVGCAIGAVVATWYAHRHPRHVRALVLSEPTLSIDESARAVIDGRAAAVTRHGMQALVPAAIDTAFANMPKDERYVAYTRMFLAHDPLGYARIAQGMVGVDLRAALRELAVPTLVAVGRHDPIFTPDLARQVHAHLERTPHAAFHQLDHAAHFPPFQDAQAFSHLVLDFLARWPGGGARPS